MFELIPLFANIEPSANANTVPDRSQVDDKYKWDLNPLCESPEAFEKTFSEIEQSIGKLSAFAGRLNQSGQVLLESIELKMETSKKFARLGLYVGLRLQEDLSNQTSQELYGRIETLDETFSKATAFSTPELIAIEPDRLKLFIEEAPGLKLYEHHFEALMLERPHVRSVEVEEVLAQQGKVLAGPGKVYECLTGQIMPAHMEMVPTESGAMVRLNNEIFERHKPSKNRLVRKAAWEGMMTSHAKFKELFATNYASRIDGMISTAKFRKYPSVLEMELAKPNLPVAVYDALVSTVRANLPLVHRYLRLKERMLGLGEHELQLYDFHVPLSDFDRDVSYEEAQPIVLKAVAPLGADYQKKFKQVFDGRRIDVMPNKAKARGAFSAHVGGSPPYILLNWARTFRDIATLIHEGGHNVNQECLDEQPYVYADQEIFSAEVASTANEMLLAHFQLSTATDAMERIYLLDSQLENIRQTIVRQTLFADFERQLFALAEAGDTITLDVICNLFQRLNEEYYGAGAVISDLVKYEWMRIPHFMRPFYVYTYATGLPAAITIVGRILKLGQPAVDAYLGFLHDGKRKYPLDSLRDAGVDMSTPEPIQNAFNYFEETLKALEAEIAAYNSLKDLDQKL